MITKQMLLSVRTSGFVAYPVSALQADQSIYLSVFWSNI